MVFTFADWIKVHQKMHYFFLSISLFFFNLMQ
jgi:hypothetical protein